MTDQTATAAPAQADTATETTATATDNGSGGVVANDWTAALDEDTRKTVGAKGWKSPADAVKSYTELFRTYTETTQNALKLPAPDAPDAEWDAVFAKMGRPEKPEGYEFKLPDGLPDVFFYDDTAAQEFRAMAHEAGLSPKQAAKLHDKWVLSQAHKAATFAEKMETQAREAHNALVKEWGDPDSESFKRYRELSNRAIRHNGGDALLSELKSVGALGPNGEVRTPALAKMLAKVGTELYAEDSLYGGPGGGGPNPFSDKTVNLTEQTRLIRTDPDRARALIRATGQDPSLWKL